MYTHITVEPISDIKRFRRMLRSNEPVLSLEYEEQCIQILTEKATIASKYLIGTYSWHIVRMTDFCFVANGGSPEELFPLVNKNLETIGFEDFVAFSCPGEVMYDNGHAAFIHRCFNNISPEKKHLVSAHLVMKLKNRDGFFRHLICHFSDWVNGADGTIQYVLLIYTEPGLISGNLTSGMEITDRTGKNQLRIRATTPVQFESERNEIQKLTRKEQELLSYLSKGYSSKLIADALHISKNTVDNRRQGLLKKFGCYTTAELISVAIRRGWI